MRLVATFEGAGALLRGWPAAWSVLMLACSPSTDLKAKRAEGAVTSTEMPQSGAATLLAPQMGAEAPPNLAAVLLRMSAALGNGGAAARIRLRPDSGPSVTSGTAAAVDCSGAQPCYAFPLMGALPAAVYTVEGPEDAVYEGGSPVLEGRIGGFTVPAGAAPDATPPALDPPQVEVAADCLRVRSRTAEPARVTVVLRSGAGQQALAPLDGPLDIDLAARFPGVPPGPASLDLEAVDLAGNRSVSPAVMVSVPDAAPPLVITEVLANPAGSELTQEFVEIFNRGTDPMMTDAFSIEDGAGSDPLPAAVLPPAGFALVVPAAYDPAAGPDPPPRAGTVLLRVPGRIGRDGISNSGEGVRLRGNDGAVVSQYGAWIDMSTTAWNGRSVQRAAPDACDHPSSWNARPLFPTPGY